MAKLRGKPPKHAKPARPRIAVFGEPGVGKTWGALEWPDAYMIDCEGGASLQHYTDILDKSGALYLGQEDGANDFQVVLQEVLALQSTQHDRKTLIIDSFSKLFNTAVQVEHDRLVAAGKKTEFGVEKKPAVSMSRQLVRRLEQLDMNAILVMHEKARWVKGEQEGVTFDSWDRLGYELNLVVQIIKQGNTRKARVIKSRHDTFKQGELVPWSYAEFAKRLGGSAVLESQSTPTPLATPDQVSRAAELIKVLTIDAATVAKVFDGAGVTTWDEMTADRIAVAIKKLEDKLPK